jgi:hypothetical protein
LKNARTVLRGGVDLTHYSTQQNLVIFQERYLKVRILLLGFGIFMLMRMILIATQVILKKFQEKYLVLTLDN